MRFKLKEKTGSHIEDGKKYKPGEVVESDRDLVAAFPEKFERVGRSGERELADDDTALVGTVVKDTPQTKRALDPDDDENAAAPRAARAGFAPRTDVSATKAGKKGKKAAAKEEDDDFNKEREED